jgi:2-oxo-4-hydroxy-4-carboxy-5-ureidoimidazoline decarboxylase
VESIEAFNALSVEEVRGELLSVCAAPEWATRVLDGRPYATRESLLAAGEGAARALSWDQVAAALAAHPRIGERAEGASREAEWSRREQSTAARDGPSAALVAANRAYEQKFGHVFLIFATGKSGEEILAAAEQRLGNDAETERAVVADELRKIVSLRLGRLVGDRA